jgi:hypothetical protein
MSAGKKIGPRRWSNARGTIIARTSVRGIGSTIATATIAMNRADPALPVGPVDRRVHRGSTTGDSATAAH